MVHGVGESKRLSEGRSRRLPVLREPGGSLSRPRKVAAVDQARADTQIILGRDRVSTFNRQIGTRKFLVGLTKGVCRASINMPEQAAFQ